MSLWARDTTELGKRNAARLVIRRVSHHPRVPIWSNRPLFPFTEQLYNFIQDIYNSYHKTNPYHNFKHAVDVLQSSYYFLCKLGALEPMANNFVRPSTNRRRLATWRIDQLLRPKDIFALLIASIGHDVGHPGVNNMFMVSALSILLDVRTELH